MLSFFIRRFNDIDHLAPIIYKVKKETKEDVQVFCQNPFYDIEKDIRLKFLRERYGVDVRYIYKAYLPTRLHRILSYLICNSYIINRNKSFLLNIFSKFYRRYLYKFVYNDFVKKKYYREEWSAGLIKKYRVSLLVFDFVKNEQYITKSLVNAAKKLKIPTVAIPSGAMLYNDRLGPIESFKSYDLPDHDYLVMQHETRRNITVSIGGPAEKMCLLGTARFCQEWHEILVKMIPPGISKEDTQPGKLKVLYIDRPIDHDMDRKDVVEMIQRISGIDFIHLLVKPHTRSNRLKFEELKKYGEIAADIDSVELVRWADVVIGTTSSILLEVLCQNKTLLYPKYINKSTMVFERMNACWCVNGLDELVSALEKIGAQPEHRPYSNKDVDKLMDKIVYCNDSKRDVLNNYKNFILDKQRRWMQI